MVKNDIILLLAVFSLVWSCTGVKYDIVSTPENTSFAVMFDFSGADVQPSGIPETMEVYMSGSVNNIHYHLDTLSGFTIWASEDEFPVVSGEYGIVSIAADGMNLDVDGAEAFIRGDSTSFLSGLSIKLNTLPDSLIAKRYCIGLTSLPYLYEPVSDVSSFYLSSDSKVPVYFKDYGESISVTLKPVRFHTNLEISTYLDIESGVTVDSVYAAVSGVPTQLNLYDKTVNRDTLGTSFFRMTSENGSTGTVRYSGNVSVLGLFPSDSAIGVVGAGVFWVGITATYQGKSKVLYTSVGIDDLIEEAGIMQTDDNGRTWTAVSGSVTLDVDRTFMITKELITTQDKERMDDWITVSDEENPTVIEL